MAVLAAAPSSSLLRDLTGGTANVLRPASVPRAPEAARAVSDSLLPKAWLAGLPVFLPVFFLSGAPSARGVLQLLAAFAAVALLALAARGVTEAWCDGRAVPDSGSLFGLVAALAVALPLGTGFLALALLVAALILTAGLTGRTGAALDPVVAGVCGALVADAGTVVLGTTRGIELATLGAALAVFARLADEGPAVVLGPYGRPRPARADLVREGALALAVLVAVVSYVALLSSRAGTVGVLGIDGWTSLLAFGGCLAVLWHRGRCRPGGLYADPAVLAAAAVTGLVTAATSASAPAFPLS